MGLLDWAVPAAGVFNQRRAGQQQGQMDSFVFQRKLQQEDEDRKREAAQAALQQQLLQLQITKAQQPDPWQPMTKEEYQAAHPHNISTENIDPLSDVGIFAALRRKRGEAAIDARYPKPPSDAEQGQEAQGDAILSSMNMRHDKVAAPFAHAYAQVLAKHPKWTPGKAAYSAMQGIRSGESELFRAEPKAGGLAAKYGTASGATPPDSLPATPTPATPEPTVQTQTIPADPQKKEAMAQRWDELTAGGLDPETARQQVLREFGGQ